MDYPKSTPGVGLVDGHFVDENPATGQVGSLIPAAWGDAITQEILNVIRAAGMSPDESNVNQLTTAVLTLAASDFKRSVLVATTGPIALSGLQNIDGVAVTAGVRVLVKNQANAAQNWIYVVSAGAWTRAQDANDSVECTPGHLIGVQSGTANASTIWQLANTAAPVLGTTALTFTLALGKTGVAAGVYRQVTVDALGRVTAGGNPTTLGGYGINDAYRKDEVYPRDDTFSKYETYHKDYLYTRAEVDNKLNSYVRGDFCSVVGFSSNIKSIPYMRHTASGEAIYLATKAATLDGYGITNAYTIDQVNSALAVRDNNFAALSQEVGRRVVMGGAGLNNNTIRIGYLHSASAVRVHVDALDFGNIWTDLNSELSITRLKLPNGFTLMTGPFSLGAPVSATQSIYFPAAFTEFFMGGWAQVGSGGASDQVGVSNGNINGMLLSKGAGDVYARTGQWFAIGK